MIDQSYTVYMCLCFSNLSFKPISNTDELFDFYFIFLRVFFFGKLINNVVVLFERLIYSFINSLNFGSTSITCGKEVFLEGKDKSFIICECNTSQQVI